MDPVVACDVSIVHHVSPPPSADGASEPLGGAGGTTFKDYTPVVLGVSFDEVRPLARTLGALNQPFRRQSTKALDLGTVHAILRLELLGLSKNMRGVSGQMRR